jgi:hypothetical protein
MLLRHNTAKPSQFQSKVLIAPEKNRKNEKIFIPFAARG